MSFIPLSFSSVSFKKPLSNSSYSSKLKSETDFEDLSVSTPRNHLGSRKGHYHPFSIWKDSSEINLAHKSKSSTKDSQAYIDNVPVKRFIVNNIKQMNTEESSTAELLELFKIVKNEYKSTESMALEDHSADCYCFRHLPGYVQKQIYKAAKSHIAILKDYNDQHASNLLNRYDPKTPSSSPLTENGNPINFPFRDDPFYYKIFPNGGGPPSLLDDFDDFGINPPGTNNPDILQRIFLPYKFDYVLSKFGIGFVIFFVVCGIAVISSTWIYYQTKMRKESMKISNLASTNNKSSEESTFSSHKSIEASLPSQFGTMNMTSRQRRLSVDLTKLDLI